MVDFLAYSQIADTILTNIKTIFLVFDIWFANNSLLTTLRVVDSRQ